MYERVCAYVRRCLVHMFSRYFVCATPSGGWMVPVFFNDDYGEIVLHEKEHQYYFPPSRYFHGETSDDHKLKITLRYNLEMKCRALVWNERREEIEIDC